MRRRLTALLLVVLCTLAYPLSAQAAGDGKKSSSPYHIMVDRAQCQVTVYGLDQAGRYTQPVRSMICSVGRQGHKTPLGTFSITGVKKRWCLMLDGSYGQYSSQFSGYYLFHSICYEKADPSTLLTEEYNMLGQPASLGCVRLETEDAKWIYDNCGAGTKVTIYDGTEPSPLGKPERRVSWISPEMDNGWDPTDPLPENPWHNILQGPQVTLMDQSFLVDGQAKPAHCCFSAEGEMYVALRSVEQMLNGSAAGFRVGWNGQRVTIQRGQPASADGGDWNIPAIGSRGSEKGKLELLVDGSPVTLEAVLLWDKNGGNVSYFRLQDLEGLLGFRLGWEEGAGTVIFT